MPPLPSAFLLPSRSFATLYRSSRALAVSSPSSPFLAAPAAPRRARALPLSPARPRSASSSAPTATAAAEAPPADAAPIVLPTNEGSPELLRIRHTSAHVMAMAVQKLFPNAQVTIGPWIDNGFYYDFDCPEPFTDQDLKKIKREMDRIVRQNLPLAREVLPRANAQAKIEAANEKYKLEILAGIPEGEDISIYSIGENWWDLCAGPHVEKTGKLNPKAIMLESVAGAYWRGSEKNAMLQRIYGTAWETPEQLEEYLRRKEEAKRRDHRVLGAKLGLFSIQEDAGGGLVFWHPKGATVRNIIENFWKEQHAATGYDFLYTPHLANVGLWKTSGHFDFYKESMFDQMDVENEQYQLKPMNCPFHCLVYKDSLRSYRELPLRWAELGTVYRYERSGTLHGLFRVRGFTQDDAHIFCLPSQLTGEILGVLNLVESLLSRFGFTDYEINLSTRPEKSVGGDDIWDKATAALTDALALKKWEYKIDEGGGAFYGPKIDIKITDAIGRSWQLSTIQCDFNLPDRFDLEYVSSDGTRQRPIMVHRAIFGSIERFFGILTESYAGDFPLWLAPVQLRLLPVAEDHRAFCLAAQAAAKAKGIRVEVDASGERLGKMIRNAEASRVPLMAVVGAKEVEAGTLAVRMRKAGDAGEAKVEEVLERVVAAVGAGVEFGEVEGPKSKC